MAVISIIGTSGVGKSFLISQLSSLNGMPAFLEGEEGVIPHEIFSNVFAGDPTERYEYFVERDYQHLLRARGISNSGLDVYVDGAAISPAAIMRSEPENYWESLQKIIAKLHGVESDLTVLLTASETWLKDSIAKRGRSSEQREEAFARSLAIQGHFLSLIDDQVLVIDRSNIDFKDEAQLRAIDSQIKAALT